MIHFRCSVRIDDANAPMNYTIDDDAALCLAVMNDSDGYDRVDHHGFPVSPDPDTHDQQFDFPFDHCYHAEYISAGIGVSLVAVETIRYGTEMVRYEAETSRSDSETVPFVVAVVVVGIGVALNVNVAATVAADAIVVAAAVVAAVFVADEWKIRMFHHKLNVQFSIDFVGRICMSKSVLLTRC